MSDNVLVQELCKVDHGLTEWEVKFVEDISKQVLDRKEKLTDKQRRKALDIWGEHCDVG